MQDQQPSDQYLGEQTPEGNAAGKHNTGESEEHEGPENDQESNKETTDELEEVEGEARRIKKERETTEPREIHREGTNRQVHGAEE